ncbi:MAG: hypothetical protein KJ007_04115 [Burkholderiales bacterium]|nr:hypothetical protein [Burkholderiales bacterium]
MASDLDRPLDRAEAFFWFLDRCSSMNFAVIAEGGGSLPTARVAAALAAAQREHPALRVAIEPVDGGGLRFAPRPGARVTLTREAAGADCRAAVARSLAAAFAPGEAPLVRAHLYDLDGGRWALALVFHHAIGDGRSGFRLMRALLDEARGERAPAAPAAPAPSPVALFPEALSGAAGLAKAQAWKEALRAEPLRAAPVPGHSREGGGMRPRIIALRFEEAVVDGLARRARREGASVHGLIGAAELVAARELLAAEGAPVLMLTSPVDLRASLRAPVDDATPAFCVTLLSTLAEVAGEEGLGPLAARLTADLRRQLAEGCGHLFYHLAAPAETLPATPEAVAGFAAWMRRMPAAFVLSNVGRVEAMPAAGGVTVDEVSFALCPMAHQPLFVAASTWGGRLALNVVHDASRLAPEAADGIAARMDRILRAAAR